MRFVEQEEVALLAILATVQPKALILSGHYKCVPSIVKCYSRHTPWTRTKLLW